MLLFMRIAHICSRVNGPNRVTQPSVASSANTVVIFDYSHLLTVDHPGRFLILCFACDQEASQCTLKMNLHDFFLDTLLC